MDRMRVHPLAELCIKAVDEDTIAQLNEQWMESDGPDRRARLPDGRAAARPGQRGARGGRARRPGALPGRRRAAGETAGHGTEAELELLTVHGILHLLGYDHAEPEEHKEMFGLQDQLLADWRSIRAAR